MICRRATGSLPSILRNQIVERGFVGEIAHDLEQAGPLACILGVSGVQQLAHREAALLRRDHLDDGGLGHVGLGQRIQQGVGRVVARRGQRPGDPGHRPPVRFRHGAQDPGQGLAVDQPGQGVDQRQGLLLLGAGQGRDDRFDGAGSDGHQPVQSLLPVGPARISAGFDLGDEPIGTIVGEKTHSAP